MALIADISMSLDGFVAGPNQTLEDPLGKRGEELHEWAFAAAGLARGARHGGRRGQRRLRRDRRRRRAGPARRSWAARCSAAARARGTTTRTPNGWWGDEPPFHHPVFVLTHHAARAADVQGGTTFTFVTDGIESALEQARAAAGDKDVLVAGGAQRRAAVPAAGLLDELQIHVAPLLLGDGVRLFDGTPPASSSSTA